MSSPSDRVSNILDPQVRAYLELQGARGDAAGGGALDPSEQALHDRLQDLAVQRGFPLIGADAGRWLHLLTRMIGGRRVFELGSGFGYSAFWFARAVGPEGQVLGTEQDPWEHDHFDRLWADHPLRARVRLLAGDGIAALAATEGSFDVVFVDIHKRDYLAALHAAVPRLRVGGLLLADNVLWGGKVTRPAPADDQSGTDALRAYNDAIHADPRLVSLVLPTGDGLGVSLKLSD